MSGTGSALRAAHPSIAASTPSQFDEAAWRRYAGRPSGGIPASAYTDDPIKLMVRYYDRAVVRGGGTSIFSLRWWS